MTKKITFLITAALMLLTMIVSPVKAVGQSDYSTDYTGNVTLSTSGGTSASSCTVRIGEADYSGIKAGTGKIAGAVKITIPANTKYLHMHIAAWNGESVTLTVTPTGYSENIALTANSGIANNSPFTFSGDPSTSDYYKVITFSDALESDTDLTFTATGGKRFVIWGVTSEEAGSSTTPSISAENVNITYDATEGSIAYTISNPVSGGALTASTTSDWLTLPNDFTSPFQFTCSANESIAARTATVTLTYTYNAKATVTKNITVTQAGDPNAPGTENNPYTVAEARTYIDGLSGTSPDGIHVHGIISQIDSYSSNYKSITYWISDDGTTTDQLEVYSGKGINGADFASIDDIALGAEVVVKGKLKKYNEIYEFDYNNQLVSYTAPVVDVQAPTITPASCGLETSMDVTITPADGTTIYYTTDGSDPDNSGTGYTTMQTIYGISETTTVKAIAYIGEQHSNVVSAVYTKITNIENITAVGTTYFVKGTVVATNNKGYIIGDGTSYIYVYLNATPSVAINDMVYVYGATGTYGKIIQFTNTASVSEATSTNYDGNPAVTVITEVPNYSTSEELHLSTYLQYEGTLTKSSSNYYINVGGTDIQISYPTTAQGEALTALDGKTVRVKGYFSGINSSSKFTTMLESVEEVVAPVTSSIALDKYSIEAPYTSTDGALIATYTNIDLELDPEAVWYESDGVTTLTDNPDWILVEINGDHNFEYTIDENTGNARSAYFRIYGIDNDGEDVYSELVTVNQAAPVTPPTPGQYEWVLTDITDLEADDVFVIVGDNGDTYAMTNDNGTNSAPATVAVTIENNKITSDVDDNIRWNISGNATNGYTFYPNGDDESWLYCTTTATSGSNNNMRVGTGARKAFELNSSNYLVTKDDNTARYLSIYNDADWRGYVNTNLCPEMSFYKKVNSSTDPSIAITPALVEATAAETPGNMAITISNMTISDVEQLSADFCDANGDDISSKPDWITDFDFQLNAGVFTGTYTIQANTTTEPRTAYFHVYGLDDDGVTEAYSNVVTVNQEASVAPVASITVNPDLVEAQATGTGEGGVTEGSLTLTLENITITELDQLGVDYCDENGTILTGTNTKPEWIDTEFAFENEVYSLNYTIAANTETTSRVAYFKVYEVNSEAYSNKVTVTQDGAVVYYSVSFDCDGGNFVENTDFPTVSENKLAGTYTLPSATKSGLTFAGWKLDGTDDIYDAGAQYEVTGNASFTAQWSSAVTATITFGSAEGSTNINSTSVTGDDSAGNTWTITTVFSGQQSFTPNPSYSQVGASSKPAESITFTTTLANEVNITAFSAKFGGFSNTAGDIALIVDETTIGTGSLNASEDVVVTNTTTESGTVLTVTVTNIAKGVKCYYISYTYEVDDTPSISINPGPYDLNSEGGDAVLPVTYTNMPTNPQAEVIFYESNGETPLTENPTWITATINGDGNVAGHIDANNTSDARSAYFKVKGIDGDNNPVYSELVTVNQAAYTLSIVFETTSLDIEAGGEQNRIISFEYEGLGENPTFTVRQYDATGQTQTTYNWLTTSITDVHKVSVAVAANTGDARSAYFKVYGENGTVNTESNLVTINQAAAAPAGETFTLLTNVDQIVAGQHYLITNGSDKAMGIQNDNNRAAADVTITAGTATYEGTDVYEVVISGPDADGNYSIYDQSTHGYLYAASSSKNWLKTRDNNSDDNSMWKIIIDNEGVASIVAQGDNSRKVMQYNGGSSIFACYGSASQSPVYLFKKNDEKTYNFYSNTTVASLTVDNDGACIVHEDVALEVTGTITNNGGADNILIMNLGQLINKNNVVATLQRDIKGYGDDPNVADGWQTIASPVDGISTDAVTIGTYDLYKYDEHTAYWYTNNSTGASQFNTLDRTRGYLYANSIDRTLSFGGEMIRTDVAVPQTLSYTEGQDPDVRGYNLMGNPFTCNLNAGDVKIDGNNVTSYSIAIPTSANLVTYNINERPIKPGEGFFVQASGENQEISFLKTASRDGVANNGYISINANTEVNFDNAYIQIGNGNTLRKMSIANSTVVYVMNDGDDYSAARVEELAGTMPVHFKAVTDGEYTITINAKNIEASTLMLFDDFTGEQIDLLETPSYTFFANESDDAARFTLMFDFNDYTGVNESYVNGNFAYQSGDELFISGDGTLQVFDVMGRFVMSKEIHGSESVSVSAFETGVYMLRFVGETVMTQKIVIR